MLDLQGVSSHPAGFLFLWTCIILGIFKSVVLSVFSGFIDLEKIVIKKVIGEKCFKVGEYLSSCKCLTRN